jgi:hypothetical protein
MQSLLDRGLIYATEGYGHVDFTVPRFDEFMRRHMPSRCRYELHPPTKTSICWAFIGAPGFEPGTSPTRIMGEICRRPKKSLQIAGCRWELTSSRTLGLSERLPGFRQ